MDEQRQKDRKAKLGVRVVGGIGDEAFGQFVQGDGDGGLQADGEEGIGRDVVMMEVLGERVVAARFVQMTISVTVLAVNYG